MANMGKSVVAVVKCDTYGDECVFEAVERGVNLLGGIGRFAGAGERIVLKPNVLIGSDPRKAVTTHPSVFVAVGRMLSGVGANVSYGDSPAFGRAGWNMKRANLRQAADEHGWALADFDNGRSVSHPNGLLVKSFVIANGVLDSDGLVSLPKLKTHGLVRFTGAIKNQFGCIPGFLKNQHHVKTPDPYDFSTMLVDVNTLVRPRLCIMDGIVAMEGNGPRGGKPRNLGILLFSSDPVALDSVACKIIDLGPECVPTFSPGERSGLGTYRYENIEVVGDEIEDLIDRSFDVVRRPPVPLRTGRFRTFVRNRTCPRPAIDKETCVNCGTCVELCPVDPKAVDWHTGDDSKQPTYKYGRCIRCYCCQESCPEGAVSIRTPLLGRVVFRHS
jgi:uncharacterized protein (DUF362 family)/Pyruvate/2-oxoacid:ferredoxin oxidoreductase delta subunit